MKNNLCKGENRKPLGIHWVELKRYFWALTNGRGSTEAFLRWVLSQRSKSNPKVLLASSSTAELSAVNRPVVSSNLTSPASSWGCSSVGRASALQAEGRQFESDQLHHNL